MDIIKIKVNLPKKVYDILINDMEAFDFTRAGNTYNKNGFINTLFRNYYPEFSSSEDTVISKVKGKIKVKEDDFPLISSIFFESRFKKDGNYSKDLQFIIQKDNMDIYDEVFLLHLRNRSMSQYFREMFILYSSMPQDKREEIIFKDIVKKINNSISNNKTSLISFKTGEKKLVDIYSLTPTREEMFDYVLGIEHKDDKRIVVSYHLRDINNVISMKEDRFFSKDEIEKLELTMYQCPAFAVDKIYDVKVVLTDIGIKLFNLYVHDRPRPYLVDGHTYCFKSSLAHIVIYFFKFAAEAKVVSPSYINEFIADRYLDAYKSYTS